MGSPGVAGQLAPGTRDGERTEPAAGGVTLGEEGTDRATGESRPDMATRPGEKTLITGSVRLRKELTEWRGVAVTVGLARRDRAKEERLRESLVGGKREQGGPTGNESGDAPSMACKAMESA